MPIGRKGQGPAPQDAGSPRAGGGLRRKGQTQQTYDPQVPDTDDSVQSAAEEPTSLVGPAVAGAAAVGGTAWLLSKLKNAPGIAGKIGKGAEYVNAARQQLMLTGMAVPKSLLGNAGAAVSASLERGSTKPLKEMFSKQTVKDAVAAYKQNTGALGAGVNSPRGVVMPGPMPGRFMGAFDEAAQKALQRGGQTADEAAREVLQAPLPPQLAEALDSPAARYLHPFRRTPFNQFLEGLKTLPGTKNSRLHPKTTAAYLGTGAAHGALTEDDEMPLSIPLAMAGTGRYGYTYGLGSILGRTLAGGKGDGGAASGMLPVSEYGITQSVEAPLRPFTKPAALTALEKLSR